MSAAALRRVSGGLFAVAFGCVALLHLVNRSLEPASRRLSEYALGPYGYLMTTAFVAVGAGLLAASLALLRPLEGSWSPRFAAHGVAVAGFGMVMSAIFPTDPDPADSVRETVHSVSSGLASVALIATAVAWVGVGRRRQLGGWRPSAPAAGFAVVAAAIGIASPWLHRSRWTGLSQRTLWIAILGWLFAALWSMHSEMRQPSRRVTIS